ncbi:MAG: hypothetical protein HPY53_02830 [Brevinematales bacterium]|nr:hypothetical protein [Brevinematales bacterium]
MRIFYMVVAFVFLSSCAVFDELLEPSDISSAVVPSIQVNSLTNNQIVGQGYSLSGQIKGNFTLASSVRVIVDNQLTQTVAPNGNTFSLMVDITNLGAHQNKLSAVGSVGKVYPEVTLTVDQHNIPLYHIPLADNQVMLIFDFSGTYDPYTYGVVPFIYGGVANFIAGAYYYTNCVKGGITIAGTGPQVMKHDASSGLYFNILTIPDDNEYSFEFGPANYSTSGWTELTNDFGHVYGKLNSTVFFDTLNIKNKKITGIQTFWFFRKLSG